MTSFGEKLRRERERRDLSVEEMSARTKIDLRFLKALEQDEFDELPGRAFGKYYIRAYAEILGFDPRDLISDYEAEQRRRRRISSAGRPARERPRRRVEAALARWREARDLAGTRIGDVAPAEAALARRREAREVEPGFGDARSGPRAEEHETEHAIRRVEPEHTPESGRAQEGLAPARASEEAEHGFGRVAPAPGPETAVAEDRAAERRAEVVAEPPTSTPDAEHAARLPPGHRDEPRDHAAEAEWRDERLPIPPALDVAGGASARLAGTAEGSPPWSTHSGRGTPAEPGAHDEAAALAAILGPARRAPDKRDLRRRVAAFALAGLAIALAAFVILSILSMRRGPTNAVGTPGVDPGPAAADPARSEPTRTSRGGDDDVLQERPDLAAPASRPSSGPVTRASMTTRQPGASPRQASAPEGPATSPASGGPAPERPPPASRAGTRATRATGVPSDRGAASSPGRLSIEELGVGRRVAGHRLEGRAERFEEGSVVVFWTRVVGGARGETIRHVWLHAGRPVQSVPLELGGSPWRTFSRKTLRGTGRWAVEARDAEGRVLGREIFDCVPAGR